MGSSDSFCRRTYRELICGKKIAGCATVMRMAAMMIMLRPVSKVFLEPTPEEAVDIRSIEDEKLRLVSLQLAAPAAGHFGNTELIYQQCFSSYREHMAYR